VTRFQFTFLALVLTQAAHSVEEYRGRLYDVFLPARVVSGLISRNLEQGFIIFNVTLVAFGLWCYFWPVRQRWATAPAFVWIWIAIEMLNGIGHLAWSLMVGDYTPRCGDSAGTARVGGVSRAFEQRLGERWLRRWVNRARRVAARQRSSRAPALWASMQRKSQIRNNARNPEPVSSPQRRLVPPIPWKA